jgi:hypothetical protein
MSSVLGRCWVCRKSSAFVDFYCDEPDCDCRRTIILVRSKKHNETVATFSYGWESREFYEKWYKAPAEEITGLALAPMSIQCAYSDELLDLFASLLSDDPEYESRFPRHYRQFKAALLAKKRRITSSQARRAKREASAGAIAAGIILFGQRIR